MPRTECFVVRFDYFGKKLNIWPIVYTKLAIAENKLNVFLVIFKGHEAVNNDNEMLCLTTRQYCHLDVSNLHVRTKQI